MKKEMSFEVLCRGCDWCSGRCSDLNDAEAKFDEHEAETGHSLCKRFRFMKCQCGKEILLDGFTNTCDCGRDYNTSGQLLASRSQWGWETGESVSDIMRIK